MEEIHQGIFGPHMIGYYWNTMKTDCVDFVKSFHVAKHMQIWITYHLMSYTAQPLHGLS